MLSNIEKAGRYLCQMYYSGILKCSSSYNPSDIEILISRCVEKPLADTKNRRGRTANYWRQLLSGDLAKLTTQSRARAMGGRAKREGLNGISSIDGGVLCELEVMLYDVVGREFLKLIS